MKPINLALTRDDGRLLTRIWNAMVVTQPGEIVPSGPPLLELDSPAASDLGWASGRIAKPDDSSGMPDASSPLIPCNKKRHQQSIRHIIQQHNCTFVQKKRDEDEWFG